MTQQATSVHASITVEAPIERAFEVFTDGFGDWFPRQYNLMQSDIVERVFEPRAGGEVYDRGADGEECHWGRVLEYEPPNRVVLGWGISPEWQVEADPDRISEVDVRFIAESDERTRVELEHRHIDRHGDGWEQLLGALGGEGGWPGCLRGYAERIAA